MARVPTNTVNSFAPVDYAAEYERLHGRHDGKRFPGYSVCDYADAIAELVFYAEPDRILDYGSGKGFQYLVRRVHEKWGGLLPHCYDVGVPQLRPKPEGKFQGIICTDVMEHIAPQDIMRTLDHIFSFADRKRAGFAFFAISCRPATRKKLRDGRNVHLTIRNPEWWKGILERYQSPGWKIGAAFEGWSDEEREGLGDN